MRNGRIDCDRIIRSHLAARSLGSHGRLNGRDRYCQWLVLPDADDQPAFCREGICHQPIPLAIASELGFPVVAVCARCVAVSRAGVPEASVNEDRDPRPGKDKVRPDATNARRDRGILAVPQPSCVKRAPQIRFWLRVGLAIASHDPRDGFTGWRWVSGVSVPQCPPSRSFLPSVSGVSLRQT